MRMQTADARPILMKPFFSFSSLDDPSAPRRMYMARMTPAYSIAASANINQNILRLNLEAPIVFLVGGSRTRRFVQTFVVVVTVAVVRLGQDFLALIKDDTKEAVLRQRIENAVKGGVSGPVRANDKDRRVRLIDQNSRVRKDPER